jgi:hypothetical protein
MTPCSLAPAEMVGDSKEHDLGGLAIESATPKAWQKM